MTWCAFEHVTLGDDPRNWPMLLFIVLGMCVCVGGGVVTFKVLLRVDDFWGKKYIKH